jgi:hypothetical protein
MCFTQMKIPCILCGCAACSSGCAACSSGVCRMLFWGVPQLFWGVPHALLGRAACSLGGCRMLVSCLSVSPFVRATCHVCETVAPPVRAGCSFHARHLLFLPNPGRDTQQRS